jgi:hypothetical protein
MISMIQLGLMRINAVRNCPDVNMFLPELQPIAPGKCHNKIRLKKSGVDAFGLDPLPVKFLTLNA